jgi:dipeptidyl aminopeptidase/acylaminoacyl peptidase
MERRGTKLPEPAGHFSEWSKDSCGSGRNRECLAWYETTRSDLRPYSEEMRGGSPAQVPERFYQRSPIHFIDQIRGRLLIIQGARDPNVTPKNVADGIIALKAAGVPYEELIFEDEGHGISKKENQRILNLRLGGFL